MYIRRTSKLFLIFKILHSATHIMIKTKSEDRSLELVVLQETPYSINTVRKLILLEQQYDQGTSYGQGVVYGTDPTSCHNHQE